MRFVQFGSIALLVLMTSLNVMASTESALDNKTIRFAVGEWRPYTSQSSQPGLLEKIVSKAFHAHGYTVTFDYFPWMRSAKLVEYNKFDGSFPWYSTDERRESFIFSKRSILDVKTVLFYHIDAKFDWQDISDLNDYRVGAVDGYSSTKLLNENGINTISATSLEENTHKLYRHRIDVFAAEKRVGIKLAKKVSINALDVIRIHKAPLINEPMYTIFPKTERGEKIRFIFDQALNDLKSSGCYSIILTGGDCG